jgi:hypothetical protein
MPTTGPVDPAKGHTDLALATAADESRPRSAGDFPDLPDAPDIGVGGGPAGKAGALGAPVGPPRPSVADKVAGFISNGQGTPGSVWRGILSGALSGMVAGAGQGHFGAGMAAGAQAQQKQQQQQFENQQQASQQAQMAKLRNAQIAELNHRIVSDTWDLTNRQSTAAEQHAEFENNMKKEALTVPGSVDLGVVKNADDLVALHNDHPDLPSDMAKGNIFSVPHFSPVVGADGKPTGEQKYDGVSAFYIPPDAGNQKIDHDISVPIFEPGKKPGEAGHYGTQTLKAGSFVTNKEAFQLLSSRSAEAAKYDNDKSIAQAQKAAADAQAALAKAQGGAAAADAAKEEGESMVDGLMDPTQLNKRAKDYDAKISAANAYSMKKFGTKFDLAKAQSDYKFANNPATQNTLRYLNSLTGPDNQSGNLGELVRVSNTVKRTEFPALNDAAAWARLQTGDKSIAAYHTVVTEVADQVAKILQGGGGGGSSDLKMKQAMDMFRDGFTKDQMQTVATELRGLLGNRKSGLIGNNRYLNRWFQNEVQNNPTGQTEQGGGGAPGPAENPLKLAL